MTTWATFDVSCQKTTTYALAANSKAGACGVLMGFINEVNGTLAKKAASPLVASAKQIEAVLGC